MFLKEGNITSRISPYKTKLLCALCVETALDIFYFPTYFIMCTSFKTRIAHHFKQGSLLLVVYGVRQTQSGKKIAARFQ